MAALTITKSEIADVAGTSSSAARWSLTWAWLITVVQCAVDGQLGTHPPTTTASLAATFIALLLVTSTPAPRPSPALRVLTVTIALAGAALGIVDAEPGLFPWDFGFAVIPIALLLPRGNILAGTVGLSLCGTIVVIWAISTAQPATVVWEWVLPSFAIALLLYLWWFVARAVVRRERAALSANDLQQARARAAETAREDSRATIAAVTHQVSPVLRDLAAGVEIDESTARLLTVVEGDVRDAMRAVSLHQTNLSSAVAAARWRGVRVTMLSDDDDFGQGTDLSGRIVSRLTDVLRDTTLSAVTIRKLPSGRRGIVTVVAVREDITERIILDADGHEI